MELHVVTCRYEGCDECSAGSHVVGVFSNAVLADGAMKEHEADRKRHLHWFTCDVTIVRLDEIKHSEYA